MKVRVTEVTVVLKSPCERRLRSVFNWRMAKANQDTRRVLASRGVLMIKLAGVGSQKATIHR